MKRDLKINDVTRALSQAPFEDKKEIWEDFLDEIAERDIELKEEYHSKERERSGVLIFSYMKMILIRMGIIQCKSAYFWTI